MTDRLNLDQHISREFNRELEELRNNVLEMGGMVERQVASAVRALLESDVTLAREVVVADREINQRELEIDETCHQILARRQPAATDLRLVIAILKTITDLERIGDEAERIGRLTERSATAAKEEGDNSESTGKQQLACMGSHVQDQIREVLDGLARMDPRVAVSVARSDARVDDAFDALMREYLTYMMENPRRIQRMLELSFAARSLERIGDHAKNIGEYLVYLVEGKDLRHLPLDAMEEALGGGGHP